MQPPLIGITTYGRGKDGRFALPVEYVDAVRRAGGVSVLLPPGEAAVEELVERLDGFVLSGGGDVDPERYGGDVKHPKVERIDAERDAFELALARAVVERRVPALSICRGCQVMNVALGGSLHEHLPDVVGESIAHRPEAGSVERLRHPVAVEGGSRLAATMGTMRSSPVTWHHQAPDRVASPLRVAARADDGTIEALELPEHPWLIAVQWHPEMSAAEDAEQQRIFDGLVAAARERRRAKP
ncbi:MAG TPA: gamma-glutamyl-gamma-aminobutyrate hydrolase family protein [Thermoanaerobaculia bacterium]|jgi:putative glutamine amidotransferase|nr:gamma-glutamyl-gamma-aminobutyrate hydrolase family protein [Thermoanaerobaculia bacterium]